MIFLLQGDSAKNSSTRLPNHTTSPLLPEKQHKRQGGPTQRTVPTWTEFWWSPSCHQFDIEQKMAGWSPSYWRSIECRCSQSRCSVSSPECAWISWTDRRTDKPGRWFSENENIYYWECLSSLKKQNIWVVQQHGELIVTTTAAVVGWAENEGAKEGSLRLGFSSLGLSGQLEELICCSHAPAEL